MLNFGIHISVPPFLLDGRLGGKPQKSFYVFLQVRKWESDPMNKCSLHKFVLIQACSIQWKVLTLAALKFWVQIIIPIQRNKGVLSTALYKEKQMCLKVQHKLSLPSIMGQGKVNLQTPSLRSLCAPLCEAHMGQLWQSRQRWRIESTW